MQFRRHDWNIAPEIKHVPHPIAVVTSCAGRLDYCVGFYAMRHHSHHRLRLLARNSLRFPYRARSLQTVELALRRLYAAVALRNPYAFPILCLRLPEAVFPSISGRLTTLARPHKPRANWSLTTTSLQSVFTSCAPFWQFRFVSHFHAGGQDGR